MIDASGVLPNGNIVQSPQDLRAALLQRPELFARAFTEKLLTYSLGRALTPYDMPTVRAVVRTAAADDYRFSTLVKSIIVSSTFRMSVVPEVSQEVAPEEMPETASL